MLKIKLKGTIEMAHQVNVSALETYPPEFNILNPHKEGESRLHKVAF